MLVILEPNDVPHGLANPKSRSPGRRIGKRGYLSSKEEAMRTFLGMIRGVACLYLLVLPVVAPAAQDPVAACVALRSPANAVEFAQIPDAPTTIIIQKKFSKLRW